MRHGYVCPRRAFLGWKNRARLSFCRSASSGLSATAAAAAASSNIPGSERFFNDPAPSCSPDVCDSQSYSKGAAGARCQGPSDGPSRDVVVVVVVVGFTLGALERERWRGFEKIRCARCGDREGSCVYRACMK